MVTQVVTARQAAGHHAPEFYLRPGQLDGLPRRAGPAAETQYLVFRSACAVAAWQRGSNENTNGLLRQFMPKATDLSGLSQTYLNDVASY